MNVQRCRGNADLEYYDDAGILLLLLRCCCCCCLVVAAAAADGSNIVDDYDERYGGNSCCMLLMIMMMLMLLSMMIVEVMVTLFVCQLLSLIIFWIMFFCIFSTQHNEHNLKYNKLTFHFDGNLKYQGNRNNKETDHKVSHGKRSYEKIRRYA